jgi:hypothetical protein
LRTPSGQPSAVCGALLLSSGHVLWARYATHKKAQHKLGFFVCGAPDTIRTCDPLVRSQVLYPAELRVHVSLPFLHPLDHILVSGPTLSSAATGACFFTLPTSARPHSSEWPYSIQLSTGACFFYFSPPTPST